MKIYKEMSSYIKEYSSKIVVIKYGGSIMHNELVKKLFIEDISIMQDSGLKIVIVHGGGKEINKRLELMNIKSEFLDGYRITNEAEIDEIEMILSGKVNNQLLTSFAQFDIDAIGISGKDMRFIEVDKKQSKHLGRDYGFVGDICNVDTKILELFIANDIIPIISPIGLDKNHKTYNINADDVASSIASSLKAEKLVFMTDVNGLYKEFGNIDSFIKQCGIEELSQLIDDHSLSGAILPKVESCISVIKKGVNSCHIVNGSIEHAVLTELFTKEGIGTKIMKEDI